MKQKPSYDGTKPQQPKPNYYKQLEIDPVEYAYRNELNCLEFNIIKRITRHRGKDGLSDLQKARNEIDMLIHYGYGYW